MNPSATIQNRWHVRTSRRLPRLRRVLLAAPLIAGLLGCASTFPPVPFAENNSTLGTGVMSGLGTIAVSSVMAEPQVEILTPGKISTTLNGIFEGALEGGAVGGGESIRCGHLIIVCGVVIPSVFAVIGGVHGAGVGAREAVPEATQTQFKAWIVKNLAGRNLTARIRDHFITLAQESTRFRFVRFEDRASTFSGEIAFENVTFSYNEGAPVLRDVSFRIRPGERVGIVGWTGSGKSTLIRLLVRLYDVDQGRVLLDGVDVRDYDIHDLRRSVGVVLQDHFLFSGSVASNISLGDPRVDAEQVRAAARRVHADGFISRLNNGYDEQVRERGSNFSMGERQLLSFARAVAFDPAVLVLDEATASVDPETERSIQAALDDMLRGRTSIIIAHRLATVRDVDRILVLHHGQLTEQGSHDELVRREGGIYRTLYNLQAATP